MRLRWAVCWTRLDPTEGHEQAGRRPVLIVSQEPFNRRSGLAAILPVTSARREPRPWEVLLPAGTAGLPSDSIVLGAHIRTVSHDRLVLPPIGRITQGDTRRQIASSVLVHLGWSDLERLGVED